MQVAFSETLREQIMDWNTPPADERKRMANKELTLVDIGKISGRCVVSTIGLALLTTIASIEIAVRVIFLLFLSPFTPDSFSSSVIGLLDSGFALSFSLFYAATGPFITAYKLTKSLT